MVIPSTTQSITVKFLSISGNAHDRLGNDLLTGLVRPYPFWSVGQPWTSSIYNPQKIINYDRSLQHCHQTWRCRQSEVYLAEDISELKPQSGDQRTRLTPCL